MPAIAMTDHGNVFGAYEFYTKAKAAGVKPIIGIEAYFTPNISRFERKGVNFYDGGPDDVSARGAYTHMTLLSETTEGMHNLFRLSTGAWRDGFFKQPRMDRELLAQHGKGLIGTTGCPSGEVQVHLRHGNYDAARQAAADFQDILGRDNYFLELMDHGLDIETPGPRRPAPARPRTSGSRCWPPTTPTTSCSEDAPSPGAPALHQLRLARWTSRPATARASGSRSTATATTSSRPPRCARCGRQVRPPRGLRQHPADRRALRRRVHRGQRHLHAALPLPAGGERGLLAGQGGREGPAASATPTASPTRSASRPTSRSASSPRWASRGYFLVVADFINWAKDNGIRVGPGRGSGAGSMVAYAMRITDLDPLEHGLIFERFLNPDRVSMPDFDIDFDERRRGEVIRYVTEKYGDDRVSDDRHLRHHQGQAGRQGLRADPRLPVRDGRPDHQGDAGRGDGQGRPAQGDLRPRAQAVRRGRRVPRRSTTPTTTSSASSTPRSASRASSASGACTPPA